MSRPANHGRTAWLNARKRQKELEDQRRKLQQEFDAIDVELDEIQQFIDLCAAYAEPTDESPTAQLQPQAVGSAEQGNGAPSQGDGTLPPIAGPCSAEEQDTPEERSGTAREAPSTHGPGSASMRDGGAPSHGRDAQVGDVENVGVQPAAPLPPYPEIPDNLRRRPKEAAE